MVIRITLFSENPICKRVLIDRIVEVINKIEEIY